MCGDCNDVLNVDPRDTRRINDILYLPENARFGSLAQFYHGFTVGELDGIDLKTIRDAADQTHKLQALVFFNNLQKEYEEKWRSASSSSQT